ncbi:hypothetical protein VI817_009105 [Penicillium citrinum]|nr:hypothetical protein VI817_009105 [Penicillium citrinum]
MTDLQNVDPVVDVDTILDIADRVYLQGKAMLRCKDCKKTPQCSIVALPTLSDGCLHLLDALCAAYDISTQPGFFDAAMFAYEQPQASIICVRSRAFLGRTELDDFEARLLVRTLLARSLIRFVELMEGLKEVLIMLRKASHPHGVGTATLRACESSTDSTMSRLAVLMQVVEGDRDAGPVTFGLDTS